MQTRRYHVSDWSIVAVYIMNNMIISSEQLVRKMQVAMTPGSNQPKKGWHPGMPLCYEE
jgi:hypothetical protein